MMELEECLDRQQYNTDKDGNHKLIFNQEDEQQHELTFPESSPRPILNADSNTRPH